MQSRKENTSDNENETEELKSEKSNLTGDYRNVAVLLLLYVMQGIPIGITAAIPILLQNRGVSYKDQAAFSFAFYPYSG
jgi:MFS transporter, PAT family, solute carrier family 33 (acetyl-CoA transportor), member 1